jgi:hypothetical protein
VFLIFFLLKKRCKNCHLKHQNSAGKLMHKKVSFLHAKADECDTYPGRPGQPGFPEQIVFVQNKLENCNIFSA